MSMHDVGTVFVKLAIIASATLALIACTATADDETSMSRAELSQKDKPCRIDDFLFVGDRGGHNTFEQFDANDGTHIGSFVTQQSGGLEGPSAGLFNQRGGAHAEFIVVNQNSGTTFAGEILRYDADTGAFLGQLVPLTDPNAPWAPRGMVIGKHHIIYVANPGDAAAMPPRPGRLARFDEQTGAFLGDLDLGTLAGQAVPRDLVVGPDGKLYVAMIPPDPNQNGGFIVRFDTGSGAPPEVVVNSAACGDCMNRPGGIAFGPDRRLYAVRNGLTTTENDTIQIFEIDSGQGMLVDHIDLNDRNGYALLFGPGGGLFITMLTPTSEVRRYNVQAKTFTTFVPPLSAGGPLLNPFYMSFRNTDPTTLEYKPKGKHCKD